MAAIHEAKKSTSDTILLNLGELRRDKLISVYQDSHDLISIQALLNGVYNSTGFVSVIINLEGEVVAKSGEGSICSKFHHCDSECAHRRSNRTKMFRHMGKENKSYQYHTCANGVVEVVIPIIVKGIHFANLFSGQFFFEKPDISYYKKLAAELDFDETSFIEAVQEVLIIDKKKAKSTIEFLLTIIQTYSDLLYQRMELVELNKALTKSEASLRESETSLRESETKYRVLFDSFPLGITISDPDGNIIENNSKALELFNAHLGSKDALNRNKENLKIIRSDGSIMPPDEYAGSHSLKQNKLVEHSIMGVVPPNKETIWLNINASPLNLKNYGVVTTFMDITKQRETENKYHMLFQKMLNGYAYHKIILDEDGTPIDYRYIDVNPAFEKMTGLKREYVVGKRVLEILPQTEKFWIETYGAVAVTGVPVVFENYSESIGKYFEVTAFQPSVNKFSCIFIDISERKKAEAELRQRVEYGRLLSHISLKSISVKDVSLFKKEVVSLLGPTCNASRVYIYEKGQGNKKEDIYQWCIKEIPSLKDDLIDIIMYWWDDMLLNNHLVACSDIQEISNPQAKQMLEEQEIKSILLIPLFVNGKYYGFIGFDDCITHREWTEADIDILKSISRIIATVTERALLEEDLQYQYTHDYLTGLYNRRFLEYELERLENEKYLPVSLIIADTNGLKLINDSFGYAMGDQVLKKAASVLQKNCRASDFVSRYGGDEFIMILPNTSENQVKERLESIKTMAEGIEIASIQLTLAFGFYTRTSNADEFQTCFKTAEDMMFQNKLTQSSSNKYKTIRLALNSLFLKSSREAQHSKRVSKLCEFIATKMNFSSKEVSRLRLAGLMHDIGKISVPEHILNKPSSLNQVEWTQMKRHPETGYRILSTSSDFIDISTAILEHHERWDGNGYPRGVKGEDIIIQARIISIADSFDAMTQTRPYKETIREEEAIQEILRCAGTQFDPYIARVFVENYHEFDYNE